jgi:hypothetical protein
MNVWIMNKSGEHIVVIIDCYVHLTRANSYIFLAFVRTPIIHNYFKLYKYPPKYTCMCDVNHFKEWAVLKFLLTKTFFGSNIVYGYVVFTCSNTVFLKQDGNAPNLYRNKNCMWWPCLLTDQDEMSKLHRGHSIDVSYQVHWNLVGIIYGMSSMKIAHFVPIG